MRTICSSWPCLCIRCRATSATPQGWHCLLTMWKMGFSARVQSPGIFPCSMWGKRLRHCYSFLFCLLWVTAMPLATNIGSCRNFAVHSWLVPQSTSLQSQPPCFFGLRHRRHRLRQQRRQQILQKPADHKQTGAKNVSCAADLGLAYQRCGRRQWLLRSPSSSSCWVLACPRSSTHSSSRRILACHHWGSACFRLLSLLELRHSPASTH
mmetsp:Transcript_46234/g.91642  ORF Transcript_46234/g.91642 Transcript_46234/m.91642 type:complete len:209 (+) Transcript_46234:488-1114(+)